MKGLEAWLAAYSESHRNKTNQRIHRVCVPLILWTVVGFFSLLRTGDSVFLSAAAPLSFAALAFYRRLGIVPFLQMLVLLGVCLALCAGLEMETSRPWIVYGAVFVLAWAGQAVGHAVEGRKPSFFEDLQFLLIGPLWILKSH